MTLAAVNITWVRLSPWAPGCADLHWPDARLRRTYYSVPLLKVVASLLRRLGRAPAEIALEERVEGEVEILGPVPDQAGPGILAIIWGGPDAAPIDRPQVAAALERIVASGWRPAAWNPQTQKQGAAA